MSPNSLNSTNGNQTTRNPQSAAAPGASNAKDFQSTASDDVLRQQQPESLSVESTGQPAEGQSVSAPTGGFSTGWILALFIIAAVVGYVLARLLREASEDVSLERSVPAATSKKKTATTAPKKTAAKTKKKPTTKRRKASAKKKR